MTRWSIDVQTAAAVLPLNTQEARAHLNLNAGFFAALDATSGAGEVNPDRIQIGDTSGFVVGDEVFLYDDVTHDGEVLRVLAIVANDYIKTSTNIVGDYTVARNARVYPDAVDNALLLSLIGGVTIVAQEAMGRTLINTTYDYYQDNFVGGVIRLPNPPLSSVTGVWTTDRNDTETEFVNTRYREDTSSLPGRVVLNDDEVWPVDLRSQKAIRVRFVGGYGATAASVPANIKQVMLDLIAFQFEERMGGTETITGPTYGTILKRLFEESVPFMP